MRNLIGKIRAWYKKWLAKKEADVPRYLGRKK